MRTLKKKKVWVPLITFLIIIFTVVFIIFPIIIVQMGKIEKMPLETNPSVIGLRYEDVSFYSRECKKIAFLQGWYLPAQESENCIILVQGYYQNRADQSIGMLDIAKTLVENNYNVLMFDLRERGESKGKNSFGYYETYDLLGAIDYLAEEKGISNENIGLLGFSLGGMISILAAEKTEIGAVVADSVVGNITEQGKKELEKRGVPSFLTSSIFFVFKVDFQFFWRIDVSKLDTKKAIKKISSPVFIIHSKEDEIIPYYQSEELYEIKQTFSPNPLDKIWILNDAKHTRTYKDNPDLYMERVINFFDEALLQK